MKNGKQELHSGEWFRLNGNSLRFEKIENGSVVITNKKGDRFVHGLENFKRIMRVNGYEVVTNE